MNQIQYLIDRYYQLQEHRIAMDAQARELTEAGEDASRIQEFAKATHAVEKSIASYLETALEDHIMWDWLNNVYGIGKILAAGLLVYLDIRKADHVSSFWKYGGFDVGPDGRARSRRKEHLREYTYTDKNGKEKTKMGITFNPFVKTLYWKIGESFVKQGKEYREIYDQSRAFYRKKFPEKTIIDGKTVYNDGHIYNMAKRRTVKLFLAHFWEEWRKRENLPVAPPYSHRLDS